MRQESNPLLGKYKYVYMQSASCVALTKGVEKEKGWGEFSR